MFACPYLRVMMTTNMAEDWALSMNANKNARSFIYFSYQCDQISDRSCLKRRNLVWLTVSEGYKSIVVWHAQTQTYSTPPSYLRESSRRFRQELEADLTFSVTTNDLLC